MRSATSAGAAIGSATPRREIPSRSAARRRACRRAAQRRHRRSAGAQRSAGVARRAAIAGVDEIEARQRDQQRGDPVTAARPARDPASAAPPPVTGCHRRLRQCATSRTAPIRSACRAAKRSAWTNSIVAERLDRKCVAPASNIAPSGRRVVRIEQHEQRGAVRRHRPPRSHVSPPAPGSIAPRASITATAAPLAEKSPLDVRCASAATTRQPPRAATRRSDRRGDSDRRNSGAVASLRHGIGFRSRPSAVSGASFECSVLSWLRQIRKRTCLSTRQAPSSDVWHSAPALIDRHGRTISYLRISVTDRCDLRCRYCMAEQMTLPAARRSCSASRRSR